MEQIKDKISLIEYINFLIKFANQINQKDLVTSTDINQLSKETELFKNKINVTPFLKSEFKFIVNKLSISTPFKDEKLNFFKRLFRLGHPKYYKLPYSEIDNDEIDEYKNKINTFINQLMDLKLSIDQFT